MIAMGKVKWFSNVKGYGFIARAEGPDVFVHHTAIESDGYRSLKGGQDVEFEVTDGPKGLQAQKVRRLAGVASLGVVGGGGGAGAMAAHA